MVVNLGKYSKFSKEDRKNIMRGVSYMSQIALTMATCVLFGVLFGNFLDNRFDMSPLFVIIFSLLGCLSGFKAMIDIAKKF